MGLGHPRTAYEEATILFIINRIVPESHTELDFTKILRNISLYIYQDWFTGFSQCKEGSNVQTYNCLLHWDSAVRDRIVGISYDLLHKHSIS